MQRFVFIVMEYPFRQFDLDESAQWLPGHTPAWNSHRSLSRQQ